ncbi:hypothetical protein HPP92_023070 [Vanilla planifolia]|uniref:DYW domain-containing protein n=1 Tax=Vanilla planifolia TaxID=51239 RepID=A0A835Q1V1_VANPL|nr:hypothetical protein HPP92_023070 [Vanilla planifolia]
MKHYVCMVDLYGRAGLLDEAFDFVKEMPIKPSKFIWGSLLSSCRKHKNLMLGEQVVKRALVLDQFDVGNYALLSRMYADVGRWKDVSTRRSIMKEFVIKANPAYSWVEDKGKVSRFTVNDFLNPSSRKINQFLEKLAKTMKDCGFIPDISNVPHDISEEQKIINLCGHTEKLALAFALVSFGCQRIIRVGKNLQVCIDCHEVFKFVSRVYDREIILKDPNRYHRFMQGYCSCRDFW